MAQMYIIETISAEPSPFCWSWMLCVTSLFTVL